MMQNLDYPAFDADAELEALYAAIVGRRPFVYRAAEDPLYRSYADAAIQNGRLAMRHSMGEAADLTGGYGSSYAQAVGQQQYDEYLRSLSQALPQLYGMAYQQYADRGQALQNAYELALQRRETDYRRGRDAADDARDAEAQAYARQKDSYQRLVQLISSAGYDPDDGELSGAGMSRGQAAALRSEYLRTHRPRTGFVSTAASRQKKQKQKREKSAKFPGAQSPAYPSGAAAGGAVMSMTALD